MTRRPPGAGKTMMAEAVANELGAMLINISPNRLKGQWGGKNGATKLLHMLYTVAREKKFAPVLVYMDQCEQFFAGGGKKNKSADKDGPSKFKKDLLLYKNALAKEDRVLFMGTSNARAQRTRKATPFNV